MHPDAEALDVVFVDAVEVVDAVVAVLGVLDAPDGTLCVPGAADVLLLDPQPEARTPTASSPAIDEKRFTGR